MNAAKITRQSQSNLALAFISLGRERRRDITIFYAFCRVIDDVADSSDLDVAEKRLRLAAWREMLRVGGLSALGITLADWFRIRESHAGPFAQSGSTGRDPSCIFSPAKT